VKLEFVVRADVEHQDGPFASREELTEAVRSELDAADPGTVDGGEGGSYAVSSWEVEEIEPAPRGRAARPIRVALTVAEARAMLELRHGAWSGAATRALERLTAALELHQG